MLDLQTISTFLQPLVQDGVLIGTFTYLVSIGINIFYSAAFPKTFRGGL